MLINGYRSRVLAWQDFPEMVVHERPIFIVALGQKMLSGHVEP